MSNDLVLTVVGAAAIEAAYNAGEVVTITAVQVGDGGGAPVTADPATEALTGMFGSEPFSAGDNDGYMISGRSVIPAKSYPGRVIRELGLMSGEGILIAYGSYPDTYLPAQSDSIVKQVIIDFMMPLVHAECVTLEIDPNIAVITQETGDKRYLQQALRLKEIADQGEEAQAEARGHLALGSAATHDVTASPNDPTPGRVMLVGAGGLLRETLAISDADLTAPDGLVSLLFKQGGGSESIHFGGYGTGVHLLYGLGGSAGELELSGNLFIDSTGNLSVEWLVVNKADGSIVTQHTQKMYGPLNKPTAADTGALPLAGGTMVGQITVSETGKGSWANQNTAGAPLYQNINTAATSEYWPIFKQHYAQANSTWSGGMLINEGDFHLHYLNSAGATTNFSFRKDGQFIPGSYANFDARYLQNIQYGAERSQGTHDSLATSKAPAGHVLNGIKSNYNDGNWEVDTIYFKPTQKYINGAWVTISG